MRLCRAQALTMGMSACGEASGFMGGEGEEAEEVASPEAAKGCGGVKECGRV